MWPPERDTSAPSKNADCILQRRGTEKRFFPPVVTRGESKKITLGQVPVFFYSGRLDTFLRRRPSLRAGLFSRSSFLGLLIPTGRDHS